MPSVQLCLADDASATSISRKLSYAAFAELLEKLVVGDPPRNHSSLSLFANGGPG